MTSNGSLFNNNNRGGVRYAPYAFTEQGVSMLSAVLRSPTAVKVSIQIIQAFVEMRKMIGEYGGLLQRLDRIEVTVAEHGKTFEKVLQALELSGYKPKQWIFFNGQIFDAYTFIADLIRSAKKSIKLIDNYVDDSVLVQLSKRQLGVSAVIYTKKISQILRQDIEKHNQQYDPIQCVHFADAHDRFLILDDNEIFHIGASLKDLGKKWFAFSKIEQNALNLIERLPSSF